MTAAHFVRSDRPNSTTVYEALMQVPRTSSGGFNNILHGFGFIGTGPRFNRAQFHES